MNFEHACSILEIHPYDKEWKSKVKKQYYLKAREVHPDKNDSRSNEEFQEINEAYQYLNNDYVEMDFPNFMSFFTNKLDDEMKHKVVSQFIDHISLLCEYQAKQIVDNMASDTFLKFYNILDKYRHILNLSADFYEFMENKKIQWLTQGKMKKRHMKQIHLDDFIFDEDLLCETKKYEKYSDHTWGVEYYSEKEEVTIDLSNTQNIIIRPTLDDIMMDNVYRCHENGKLYIVPLWHHEIIYVHDDLNINFNIIPKMPSDNYWIDGENNLHQIVEYTLLELWDYTVEDKHIEVHFGKKRLIFYPNRLRMQQEQIWEWKHQGISKINYDNVYDVSIRSDVILHIKNNENRQIILCF